MASVAIPAGANIEINEVEPETDKTGTAESDFDSYVDDGKGNRDLPEKLKEALKKLLTHYGQEVDKFPRRIEVVDARRQRFYDRGYQYIYFNWGQYVFVPVVGGVTMQVGGDAVSMPRYCNVYDIYKPYRRNFCAVLTQNTPGVNFEPKRPTKAIDIKSAECANVYSAHYDAVNNPKQLQSKIARLFWTDGRVVALTEHVKNAQKYGYQTIDKDGQEVETEEPNGEEITTVYGVLEAKVFPLTANNQDELTGVIISDDPEINRAKADYEWIKEKIKTGSSGAGESEFERNARIGILQGLRLWAQSGEALQHLTERQRMFLRPAAFQECEEAEQEKLEELFPDGVRCTFVSGEYAEGWNCSLDDAIEVEHALDGDGMNRPSWGKGMVPVQDAYNNYRNMRQEYHDYGIPFTAYDSMLTDGQALREKISQPGEFFMVVNPQPGTPIEQYFYTPAPAAPPQDLIEAEQDLRDALSQLITGVQPALFGGQISKDDRVGVYAMAREQAMGVMGLPWGVIQKMFCRFKYQAILAAKENRPDEEEIVVQQKKRVGVHSRPLSTTIGDLSKGNFRAVPNSDSGFPETRSMRKQAYEEFMGAAEANPILQEAAMQPDNIEMGKELEGLEDLDIPAARASNRQLDEIDQLLSAGPIPPSYAQLQAIETAAAMKQAVTASAQGQAAPDLPPQMKAPTAEQYAAMIQDGSWANNPMIASLAKCSLEPDEEDYHQYHLQAIKNWFNSEERDKAVDAGNTLGILNIRLHKQLHEKYLQAEQAKAGASGQQKVSQSISFKDMPPSGKVQMAAEAGIQLSPGDVIPPAPVPAAQSAAQPAAS